jgi:hypothetical protein
MPLTLECPIVFLFFVSVMQNVQNIFKELTPEQNYWLHILFKK